MTNWKCQCGVVNFSTDVNCKRCQGVKTAQAFSAPMPEIYEHSAPNGDAASGILKAIGIGTLIVGIFIAILIMSASTGETQRYAIILSLFFAGQGLVVFALFYGFGVAIENLVAIRKNTQHLAGIRINSAQQWQ